MRVSLSQMVMQSDTRIYPGSGKRRPYVQQGERIFIILHLSACTGVNTSVVWSVGVQLRMSEVLPLPLPLSPLLGFPFYSSKEKPKVQV